MRKGCHGAAQLVLPHTKSNYWDEGALTGPHHSSPGCSCGFATNVNIPAGMGFPQVNLKFRSDNFKTCLSLKYYLGKKNRFILRAFFPPVKLCCCSFLRSEARSMWEMQKAPCACQEGSAGAKIPGKTRGRGI